MTKRDVIKLGRWPKEFLEGLVSEIPDIYAPATTKLVWSCPVHGEYKQTISYHLLKLKCPKCNVEDRVRKKAIAMRSKNPFPQWFIDDLEGSPDKEAVLSHNLSVNDYARFICPIHGEYRQKITHHLNRKDSCPRCTKRSETLHKTLRHKCGYRNLEYLKTAINFDEFLRANDELIFVCPIHGEYRRTLILADQYPGCGRCHKSLSQLEKEKIRRSAKVIPEYLLNEMIDSKERDQVIACIKPHTSLFKFRCPIGHEYQSRLNDRMQGHGCPTCAAQKVDSVSSYEKKLKCDLESLGLEVIGSCRTEIRSEATGRPAELDLFYR